MNKFYINSFINKSIFKSRTVLTLKELMHNKQFNLVRNWSKWMSIVGSKFVIILISIRKSLLCLVYLLLLLVKSSRRPFHNFETINGNAHKREYSEADLNITGKIIFYSQSFKYPS